MDEPFFKRKPELIDLTVRTSLPLERALVDFLRSKTDQRPTIISVVAVEGRFPMAPVIDHAPDLNLSATQKVTLSVAPVLTDGTPAPGPHVWSTSDPTALPVTPAADGLTAEVSTPLDNGQGVITFTSPGVRTADIKVIYTAPIEGRANLSAGVPQED